MKFLESVWHGRKSHGILPNCVDDLVDDHGSSFEKFGQDGVVVIKDGSARQKVFLFFDTDSGDLVTD